MRALNYDVPRRVDEFDLGLRGFTPEDEDDGIGLRADLPDNFVRERLPAAVFVREGLSGAKRQDGVQE